MKRVVEIRYAKVTVKGDSKEEVEEMFKLLAKLSDVKIKWIKTRIGGGFMLHIGRLDVL